MATKQRTSPADPTAAEMRRYLARYSRGLHDTSDPGWRFDREEAIYWFAYNWHGGQSSNLYSALSTSQYRPGPMRTEPLDPELYDALVAKYVNQD